MGFIRDFFDAYAKASQQEIHYQLVPVKRLFLKLIQDKSIDLKYPDHPNWGHQLKFGHDIHYSLPIVETVDAILAHKDNHPLKLEQLTVLATIRGFTPAQYMNAIESGQITLIEFNDSDSLLHSLLAKRVPAAFINVDVAKYLLKHGFNSQDVVIQYQLPHLRNSFHASSTNEDTVRDLNHFLKHNKKVIHSLRHQYDLNAPYSTSKSVMPVQADEKTGYK